MPYFQNTYNLTNTERRSDYFCPPYLMYGTTAVISSNFVSNSSYWIYVGETPKIYAGGATITAYCNIQTAVATITWAEIGLYYGSYSPGSSVSLTRLTTQDVSATFNSIGLKTMTFTLPASPNPLPLGTGLWIGMGSQATTTYKPFASYADGFSAIMLSSAATRLSTHGDPINPGTVSTLNIPSIYVAW